MVPLRSKRLLRFVSIWLANLFFLIRDQSNDLGRRRYTNALRGFELSGRASFLPCTRSVGGGVEVDFMIASAGGFPE